MIKRKRGEEGRVRREEERARKGSQCSCLTGNDDSDDQNNLGGEEEEEDRQLDSPKYATSGKAGGEFLFGSLKGGADRASSLLPVVLNIQYRLCLIALL